MTTAAGHLQGSHLPRAQSKALVLTGAVLLVTLIGVLDLKTQWEISMWVLYALPVVLVVWHVGRGYAVALAVICTLVWLGANMAVHPYQSLWGYPVAGLSRLIFYLVAAFGTAAVKARRDAERDRIEALERTRELERDIVRASEHEQQRIGRDLHDGICQQLAAIGCAAKALADDLEANSQQEASAALEIEAMLRDAIDETRRLARGIYPVQMSGVGLAASLTDLASSVSRLTGVKVTFQETSEPHTTNPDQAMHLYRIAQEALNNAIRHGGAREVNMHLKAENEQIELSIADNGSGLPANGSDGKGMGLRTMQYRARALGANLTIDSKLGGGTTVRCNVKAAATHNRP